MHGPHGATSGPPFLSSDIMCTEHLKIPKAQGFRFLGPTWCHHGQNHHSEVE